MDWTAQLLEQLTFHWDHQARSRLEGLTDSEYFWEPAPAAWSLRPRSEARTPMAAGAGELVIDFAMPVPEPAPLTTIAWRLGHVIVGVFGARNAAHFGGPPLDYTSMVWPATADAALAELDAGYRRWIDGAGSTRPTWDGRWARPRGRGRRIHTHHSCSTSTVK